MASHVLKTDPKTWDDVASGAKTHEIRLNDRDYQVGDELVLRKTKYTGDEMSVLGKPLVFEGEPIKRTVSHIQHGYGLMGGWVILSFASEVSRLATGRGWLPIESAPLFTPLDGPIPPCLVYAPGYGVCMGAAGQDKFGHKYAYINSVSGSAGDIVTHFMPLPAAPGAAQGEVN